MTTHKILESRIKQKKKRKINFNNFFQQIPTLFSTATHITKYAKIPKGKVETYSTHGCTYSNNARPFKPSRCLMAIVRKQRFSKHANFA